MLQSRIWKRYWKHRYLMSLFLPAVLYYLVFHYAPLYGIQIAFKDFIFRRGIWASPWVGLTHFSDMFELISFREVFANTLIISLYKLVWGFPVPIIFALLINELRSGLFKKITQTVSYLPHFISWVILGGLFLQFLSPSLGPINQILKALGASPIYFLADPAWFRSILVMTMIWKEMGWSSIIYLAALTGVEREVYEAALADGAGRFRRMWHVSLPALIPVFTIMLIFAAGSLIQDDFDQIFNLYNASVYRVADVLSTYTYRTGLVQMNYSFATAVGLFKNLLAFALVVLTNGIARKINDYSIW